MGYKMPYMMHVIGKYCIKIVSKVAKAVVQIPKPDCIAVSGCMKANADESGCRSRT